MPLSLFPFPSSPNQCGGGEVGLRAELGDASRASISDGTALERGTGAPEFTKGGSGYAEEGSPNAGNRQVPRHSVYDCPLLEQAGNVRRPG